MYLWSVSYTTIFDDRNIKVPIISVLDEASYTEIGKDSTNDNVFYAAQFLFQRSIIERANFIFDNNSVRSINLERRDELSFWSEIF